MSGTPTPWDVWIDTGGTFTDCVAVAPQGEARQTKVLSHGALRGTVGVRADDTAFHFDADWRVPPDFLRGFRCRFLGAMEQDALVLASDPVRSLLRLASPLGSRLASGMRFELLTGEEAPILALRLVTGTALGEALPPVRMRLATTRGTNALLERRGAPVLFLVTRGFGDLLCIGTQQRPELFALEVRKPEPLYASVLEVPERLDASGRVLLPLDVEALLPQLRQALEQGVRCAAIALLHSWVNPDHELQLAAHLKSLGFESVSCSAALAPFQKILPRAETAVVDATLSPVIAGYLERVQGTLSGSPHAASEVERLLVMTSAGGLVPAGSYRAKDSLLSGPAAGVVGAAHAARSSGFARLIAFDMGGTSTDVSRHDGDFDYVFEQHIGNAHLLAPALAIETVAAGGGSICRFAAEELHVGPESAAADPGPACYGSGGPLTLTDVNLLLGRLHPDHFAIPVDEEAARRTFQTVWETVDARRRTGMMREHLLEGFLRIANERMAEAVRRISVRQGYDARNYVLVAFGGAGGQHACAVAGHLGITTILVPPHPAMLSALGLGHAVLEQIAERQILETFDEVVEQLPEWIVSLETAARERLIEQGAPPDGAFKRRVLLKMRFRGQESSLLVEDDGTGRYREAFEDAYRGTFGYWPGQREMEIESLRVVLSSTPDELPGELGDGAEAMEEGFEGQRTRACFAGVWQDVPLVRRVALPVEGEVEGPALILESYSVVVVEPGWTARVDSAGALLLRQAGRSGGQDGPGGRAPGSLEPAAMSPPPPRQSEGAMDPVQLDLFAHRFEAIARNMGEMLGRTAVSTNVKERLDYSCALLDADGELIVHAPHIPVHLGALGLCVRSVQEACPMQPGDVVVTNHPDYGGSHLPDVTVITPVDGPRGQRLGYVASRAHHAEIGGTWPGSMPPTAKVLAEEGVVIAPRHLFRQGEPRWDSMRSLLRAGPHPSRGVEENLADLRAAVAANRLGAQALVDLAEAHGDSLLRQSMRVLKERAAARIRAALEAVPAGTYDAREELDDGTPLVVRVEIGEGKAFFDFTGSGDVHPGSLNATPAVVHSAVLYVLRLLVQEPLPLNEGLMHAVTVHIPRGLLNPFFGSDPQRAPAVCGGNVETSQRLVDVLLRALELAACSQGTMNNVLFGDSQRSYYETVCGGAGAGSSFPGASAVHTHMTNTRITDPEVLEHRHPVRLDRFALRHGSGGAGRYRGGDGVIREMTFLAPLSLTVLGQHRREGPYGLHGGGRGWPARQRLQRADGSEQVLGSIDGCAVQPGDRFLLETPGGGGWGNDA